MKPTLKGIGGMLSCAVLLAGCASAASSSDLSPVILLPGIGMLAVAIGFVVYSLRHGGTWGMLGLGGLAWVVTVAVKFAIALVANPAVSKALYVPENLWAPSNLLLYVYLGALTGVTEVLLTWWLLHHKRLARAPWGKAVAFGIGFGALEALLLGGASLAAMLAGLLTPQSFNAETLTTLARSNDVLYDLAPITERLAIVFVHLFCNVLLFYGVLKGQARWMWLSFVYKSAVDTVAAFAQLWGVETTARVWSIEAFMVLFGVVAWWGVREIGWRYRAEVGQGVAEPEPPVINA
jgi:uncharacterized membrane protein YhfC